MPCICAVGELLGVAIAVTNELSACATGPSTPISTVTAAPAIAPPIARQSRLPIMYAAIPITSWGLAIAAVNPSANPAAPGVSRRQSDVGGGQADDGDTVPLPLEKEQPGAEARQRDEHDRHAGEPGQRRGPRRGAGHQPEREQR